MYTGRIYFAWFYLFHAKQKLGINFELVFPNNSSYNTYLLRAKRARFGKAGTWTKHGFIINRTPYLETSYNVAKATKITHDQCNLEKSRILKHKSKSRFFNPNKTEISCPIHCSFIALFPINGVQNVFSD